MKRSLWFCLTLVLCGVSHAQPWSGIIDSSRTIDWSKAGVIGGIPSGSWPICQTLGVAGQSPSYAQSVSGAAINSAISTCASSHPTGSVVMLNPGTYSMSTGIRLKSYVALRGSGANQTLLVVPSSGYTGTGCMGLVCFNADSATWPGSSTVQPGGSNAATWTGGFAQGTTQIVLNNIGSSGISVGQYLILDQANVSAPTGNLFYCDTPVCGGGNPNGMRVVNGVDHGMFQIVQVTGCTPSCTNGATFTISPGLYSQNWSSSLNPGAWWWKPSVTHAGIENLTLDDRLDSGNSGSILTFFYNCDNSWETGVASYMPGRSHAQLAQATHITIANNYRFGNKNNESSSYGDETFLAGDSLIQNNIYQQVTSPMLSQLDTGTAHLYNYDILDLYCYTLNSSVTLCNSPTGYPNNTPGGLLGLTTTNHNPGVLDVLWEGNITPGYKSDDIHGSGAMATYFRNQVYGWSAGSATPNGYWNWAFTIMSYNRALNVVGNVIGKPGYTTVYQGTNTSSGASNGAAFDLGWADYGTVSADPGVAATLLRWGNWDAATGATRWCASNDPGFASAPCNSTSEIPTGIGSYASANPTSGRTLPPSFYYSSRPSWWPAGKPWPAIGPDVSGGNLAVCTSGTYKGYLVTSGSQCAGGTSAPALNGMVNSIPAMDCYLNVMGGTPDGSGPALTNFNASACYTQQTQTQLNAPQGVKALAY